MLMRAGLLLVALLTIQSTAALRAQESADLDVLLDQLGRYLIAYESELSTVIAVEQYDQQEIRTARSVGAVAPGPRDFSKARKLESDIAFLRLPGGGTWFGVRDVRRVDKRPVSSGDGRLAEIMSRLARTGAMEEATRIVAASAQYNLGAVRTINMPTTPLEVLHPDHHVQFAFKLAGKARIDSVSTSRISFEEFDVPTIISGGEGEPLFIRGNAWVEPGSGRLWRVEMAVHRKTPIRGRDLIVNRLRVDFTLHPELKMLVPKEMTEAFFVPGGRGEGRAKYSGYRRFTTTARILPN
jgi:hypothetical protein